MDRKRPNKIVRRASSVLEMVGDHRSFIPTAIRLNNHFPLTCLCKYLVFVIILFL